MWFLEHESLFGGKRVWLRPGSQQLFGRTKSSEHDGTEGKSWKIDNKAVSRKHVMLKVLAAPPDGGTKLHTRSQIEVTDLSCRQGTTIDEKDILKSQKAEDGTIVYAKAVLKGPEHVVRLAQGYAPFKIVWRPVVFTYASKETKEAKARNAQLHALDIKTTADFQFDKTTHVVSQKRNLPKVLAGLTAAKHIVTGDFLDAIIRLATASVDAADNYVPSQLEEDFDMWWPKEKEYVPPVGAEPVPQPQELLQPDVSRSEVFSGLTFVFLNEGQHSSLLDPVSGGGGKALLYHVRPGETTVDEYVDYVHSVAGKKKRGGPNGDKLSVVTVRLPSYPDAMEAWAANFVTGVDQALRQRSVLQNEFLDVILTKDRSALQRPPSAVIEIPSTAPEPATQQRSLRSSTPMSQARAPSHAPEDSAPKMEEPAKVVPRKRTHRAKTTSRFTGFDDYEPPVKKKKIESTQLDDIQESTTQEPVSQTPKPASTNTQTRFAPPSPVRETVEKEEQLDILFPTAAKFRRQKEATLAPSALADTQPGASTSPPKTKGTQALERLQRAKAKADKEINVREQTRQRIQDDEDRRRADEASLREALEGIDIAEMKNLAPIEDMPVLSRAQRSTARNPESSDRWDPAWNGRANFKKFRRRGAEQGVARRKVLVALQEAPPKKGFGVGDAFFLEVENEDPVGERGRGKKGTGKGSQRRGNEEEEDDDESDPEPGFTRRKPKPKPTSTSRHDIITIDDSASDAVDEDEHIQVRTTQRSSGTTQRIPETQVDDDDDDDTPLPQTQRGKKRGSGGAAPDEPGSKRGKTGGPRGRGRGRQEDDSDEEETGFRFRRKR